MKNLIYRLMFTSLMLGMFLYTDVPGRILINIGRGAIDSYTNSDKQDVFSPTERSTKFLKSHEDQMVFVRAPEWSGSAVMIGDGVYSTAKHVVDGLLPVDLKLYTNEDTFIVPVKIVTSDKLDIALIYTKEGAKINSALLASDFAKGNTIFKLGHSYALDLSSNEGQISMIDGDSVVVSIEGFGGDSGGGLFNEAGQLVGVISLGGKLPIQKDYTNEGTTHTTPVEAQTKLGSHSHGMVLVGINSQRLLELEADANHKEPSKEQGTVPSDKLQSPETHNSATQEVRKKA